MDQEACTKTSSCTLQQEGQSLQSDHPVSWGLGSRAVNGCFLVSDLERDGDRQLLPPPCGAVSPAGNRPALPVCSRCVHTCAVSVLSVPGSWYLADREVQHVDPNAFQFM